MYDTEVATNQQFVHVNRQEFDVKYVYLKNELKQELSKQLDFAQREAHFIQL